MSLPAILGKTPTALRSATTKSSRLPVDEVGGAKNAGIIYSASAITVGEAIGHDMWIDRTFVAQVRDAMLTASPKVRFTHPGLSSDGAGKYLGRAKLSKEQPHEDKALVDIHFSQTAHKTPNGNLALYTMDLAREDSEALGLSIVFEHDIEAQSEFENEHVSMKNGTVRFISPDPANTKNLRHVRLASLKAMDVVDDPAANPDGMFHRDCQVLDDAKAIAAFAVGIEPEVPSVVSLSSIDPSRLRAFVARFLDEKGLEIRKKEESTMSADVDTVVVVDELPPVVDKPEQEKPSDPVSVAELSKPFRDLFGEQQGSVMFARGLSFAQAQQEYIAQVRQENESLKKRLSAMPEGGEPGGVQFSSGEATAEKTKTIRIAGIDS